MSTPIAIDFGTTNSVVAAWNNELGLAEILRIPGASQPVEPALIPSLIQIVQGQTGEIRFGQSVKDSLLTNPPAERVFRNFKRGILTADEKTTRTIDGTPWNAKDAGKSFVQALVNHLPIDQAEISQLVLTAPVTAFSHYVNWLTDAFDGLLVDQVRVVDESTAAALGYAVTEPGALVLVIDFGGGSLDLSLVKLPKNRQRAGGFLRQLLGGNPAAHTARVIAKAGQVLGGSDVDQWLMDEVLQRCRITSEEIYGLTNQLLTACENLKIQLSSQENASLEFEVDQHQQKIIFTREELERLLQQHQFHQSLQQVINSILNAARRDGIFREDIQNVLLVGGMSQMPLVQETLAKYFPTEVLCCDKPFTAVVEGALQIAAGYGLEDFLNHSYGLRYFDIQGNRIRYEEILPAGTRYPSKNPVEVLLGSAYEGQQEIELVIGEINPEAVTAVDVYHEENMPVFIASLSDHSEAIRPINLVSAAEHRIKIKSGKGAGEAHLLATFRLDELRRLSATVKDLQTNDLLLEDTLLADLEADTSSDNAEITSGHEPTIAAHNRVQIGARLSIRQLANLLSANVLPPEAYSLESAAAMLYHKDLYVRFEASRMLSRRGDRQARLILQEALQDGRAPTRASAIRHVAGLTWYGAEPLLIKALADDEFRVREAAVFAICELGDRRGYYLAAKMLQTEIEDDVFAAAAWGLRNSTDAEAVPMLEAALQAQSLEVQEQTLESLGTNGSLEAAQVIQKVLVANKNPSIQYAAALSLLEILGEACLPELAQLVSDSSDSVRLALLQATFHASNYMQISLDKSQYIEKLLAALEISLADPNPEVRLAAIWPLAWMHNEKATDILINAYYRVTNQELQPSIAHILESLNSPAWKVISNR